jgi:WD40 repeat protein
VRALAFTQDGSCVLSGSLDARYWLWTVEDGGRSWIPVHHTVPVAYSALSPTARYMVAACGDQFVYIWDVPSGAPIVRYGTRRLFDHLITAAVRRRGLPQTDELLDTYLAGEAVYKVHMVRMSPDGSQALFSATTDGATTDDSRSMRAPARQEGGGLGAPGRMGACLLALNIETGEIHSVSVPQTEPISVFAVDARCMRLLWATQDHALELWDLQREKRIATLRGHSERVNAVVFSPDGTRAVSCGRDRILRVWDLASGTTLAAFTADAELRSLALAADDGILAAGDMAGRIHFLRLVAA